jgi:hypothetical protein
MIWARCFEKLFDVIGKLLRLVLRITLGDDDELLVGVASVLVIIALITSGGDRDSLWSSLRPPLIASSTPPCTLVGCLGWRPRPLLGATLALLYTKIAPTASSPEACVGAMSRSSFVAFGWSQSSSCTRVRQFVPNQNAKMTSTSQILGSS